MVLRTGLAARGVEVGGVGGGGHQPQCAGRVVRACDDRRVIMDDVVMSSRRNRDDCPPILASSSMPAPPPYWLLLLASSSSTVGRGSFVPSDYILVISSAYCVLYYIIRARTPTSYSRSSILITVWVIK